jgi:DNA repair protein RecO (recombination protein O)
MGRTYNTTGINLKAAPLGETDRLLTILTPQEGLVRAVAPGSRKHQSRLGGRSDLFVINDCLIVRGRGLDKLVQAETLRTFPGLGQDLGRLTASQYLAEVVLFTALSGSPQADLFHLFVEHLERLERSPQGALLAALSHGLYHLLALGGVAPEVHRCCISQQHIVPDLLDPNWAVEFSVEAGGLIMVAPTQPGRNLSQSRRLPRSAPRSRLTAIDVALLQQLTKPELITTLPLPSLTSDLKTVKTQEPWSRIERLLRQYAQDYFERPIRSAALVDVCFATV